MLTTQPDVTDALAIRYYTALHAQCPAITRRRRECAWAPSNYCDNCGRPMPSLLPGQPGEIK